MSETTTQPGWLRAGVFMLCGDALVATWLQPVYEIFADGAVIVPRWWSVLSVISLALLLIAAMTLTARHRSLGALCWITLLLCLGSFLLPGYA